jgi:hypothetical protein
MNRTSKMISAVLPLTAAALMAAGCGGSHQSLPQRPVYTAAAPSPSVAQKTIDIVSPKVLEAQQDARQAARAKARAAAAAKHARQVARATKTFSGSGNWNSPTFAVGSTVTVTFSYSGNTSGFGGDNFIADLQSSGDDQAIANDIAVSGGKTTTIYPDTSFGGTDMYYLSVMATGSWTFKIQTGR